MFWGFAQTDRGIAFAGAGTIGTELKAEQHFASSTFDGETNVGLIRRDALLTFISLSSRHTRKNKFLINPLYKWLQ